MSFQMNYVVRVASRHTGEVFFYKGNHTDKRGMRTEARGWARKKGLTGRLKVSVMVYPRKRVLTTPKALGAAFESFGNATASAAQVADVYEKTAASIFPVTVVRVADDPNYSRPRFHVKDANGSTVKNCKTKREADEIAARINKG